MIFEHYIIILLWAFGGEVTINHLKLELAYKREYDWVDEVAFFFIYVVWPLIVAFGMLNRIIKRIIKRITG